ncbi:MAG: type IX secretion system membrane protein PorP/SprF [Microscillaceae bacterium]|nr:type IX secretion system membrane protein PorP/SprF [Microscillaceae bacterium]MDW8460561.1 type IX secretion system membrane protein PorP/SprF [Cytophagales bacterium]
MTKKYIIFSCLICVLYKFKALTAYSQQDAQFSQYIYNQLFFNPAFAGVQGNMQTSFFYRNQWLGYNPTFDPAGGNPVTQTFSLHTALKRLKSGVGLHIVNDKLGALSNFEIQLSLSHHIKVKTDAKISIGVRTGLYSKTIDFNALRAVDENDPLILGGKEAQMVPDMAVGIYYQSPTLFGGFMTNHLLPTEFDFGTNATGTPVVLQPLSLASYLVAGYNYALSPTWQITPSTILKTNLNNWATFSFETSVLATYSQKFWGGLSYRHQDAVILIIGTDIPNGKHTIRIGYSFDYVVFGKTAKQRTSHELSVTYLIPVKDPIPPAIIRTPRFRHTY